MAEYEELKQAQINAASEMVKIRGKYDNDLEEKENIITELSEKINEIEIYYKTQLEACLAEIKSNKDAEKIRNPNCFEV